MTVSEEVVRGLVMYLYGEEVWEKMKGDLRVEFSGRSGALRRVYLNGKLIFILRASDGYLIPTIEGARLINKRVIVRGDAAKFIREGRSVITKSVINIINALPGEEVGVFSEDGELLGVGRLMLSMDEVSSLGRGVVVKMRQHVR
ncbi:PUA domain-containing protein [Vulcanisaeta thermophila]|uniref:PUA domain-containing protein n=1 Tax=Vulcanisaeta thermophila TaxID=867917 RepID=UPI000853B6A1|nr:PUA domain-containing protein [Vulcanisaeta thermophila]